MSRFILDCETNGLLDTMDVIHSLCMKDLDTGVTISACDRHYTSDSADVVTTFGIEEALRVAMEAGELIGHNLLKFDIPALQIVYPWFKPKGKITDTLILSRLIWSDMKEADFAFRKKVRGKNFPGHMIGRHSLESWGLRLQFPKDDYKALAKEAGVHPWAEWWPTMQTYCERDVEVTGKLYELIQSKNYSEEAIELEHDFADIIFQQEQVGFPFDVKKAEALYQKLATRRDQIGEELQEVFPPLEVRTPFTPKANNSKFNYQKGVPTFKTKTVVFNPGSRDHIAARLKLNYGWEPKAFTAEGKAQVDEQILSKLPYPEAPILTESLLLTKRIGQLAEGRQAWLKLEKAGRIYGQVVTNGTPTARCTHSRPNITQVPASGSLYGEDCRSLFHAPTGYKLVGADASGLELRCLAHYMARYDGGAYAKEILEGDVHSVNQHAAGLPTRDNAKTFIYAFLYGAGDAKIGEIIKAGAKEGKRIKEEFLRKTPALKALKRDVQAAYKTKKGLLVGIDGRVLHCRSSHSALNTLLQASGALLVKKATVLLYQDLSTQGYKFGTDWSLVAHIHDEVQMLVKEGLEDHVGQCAVRAFQRAGEHFNWRCPTDGEFKVGNNWAETH
jgi:hypothetical protein